MHITILALGSRGDVQPYATLGIGLKQAGHQVRLITFKNFAHFAKDNGLEFHPIRGDAQALVANGGTEMLSIMRSFGSLAEGYAQDLSAPHLGETDLILNQLPAGLYGFDLAEKYGLKMVQAAVIPLARTRTLPLMGFPRLPLPGYNKATYYFGEQMAWQMFRPVINHWRRQTLGLPALPMRRQNQAARHALRRLGAVALAQEVQATVERRRHPGRGHHLAGVDVEHAGPDLDLGVRLGQLGGVGPVGGRRAPFEQARGGQHESPQAQPDDGGAARMGIGQRPVERFGDRLVEIAPAGHDDDVGAGDAVEPVGRQQAEAALGAQRALLQRTDAELEARQALPGPILAENQARHRQVKGADAVEGDGGYDGIGQGGTSFGVSHFVPFLSYIVNRATFGRPPRPSVSRPLFIARRLERAQHR